MIRIVHRESKAELTDRLRREGHWDVFVKRREELKAEGVPAKHAWFEAAVEYPPQNGKPANDSAPKVDLTPLKGKPAVPVLEAATWVFEYLDCDWTMPADAPSAGAWSLLSWARSSMVARMAFYKMFGTKVISPPQEAVRKAENNADAHERELMARLFGKGESDPEPDPPEDEAHHKELLARLFGESQDQAGNGNGKSGG